MANTYTSLYIHCVFSTKKRLPLILPEFQKELWAYIGGTARKHKIKTLAVGGVSDHVHILLSLPATISVSKAVQFIKGSSSRWFNERFENTNKFAWQEGYGAFSVNASILDKTIRYIQTQPEHHRRKTFQEEYISFLKKHKINYNEKYVWN